jgi:hypothetical protein
MTTNTSAAVKTQPTRPPADWMFNVDLPPRVNQQTLQHHLHGNAAMTERSTTKQHDKNHAIQRMAPCL